MYASDISFVCPKLHPPNIRNTRYGWLVRPYPTGTLTLKEMPSLAWRTSSRQFLSDSRWPETVIPAEAGIQSFQSRGTRDFWTPAFAGVTGGEQVITFGNAVVVEGGGERLLFGGWGRAPGVQQGPHRSEFLSSLVQLLFFGFGKRGKQAVFPFLEPVDFAQQLDQRQSEISAASGELISRSAFYHPECPGNRSLLTRLAVWWCGGPPYSISQFIRGVGQWCPEGSFILRGRPLSRTCNPDAACTPQFGILFCQSLYIP